MATYAVFQKGSKQYRVKAGDVVDVDIMSSEPASHVTFDQVLFVNDEENEQVQVGAPHLADCKVTAEVIGAVKGPKEYALKYKRRKRYRRKIGHRQQYTRVKILEISK